MKNYIIIFIFLSSIIIFSSCGKNEDIDKEKPTIDLTIKDAFPINCDTLYFGETFTFKVLFTDNAELGSNNAFSIDIHNNFTHHSHSTEVTECNLAPIKAPINPFLIMQAYDIPTGLSEYETKLEINIPYGNEKGLFDDGDYHFFISLADKDGWSTQKGLSIKMFHR